MKKMLLISALMLAAAPALAAEPDGLTLPPGFHATVVAEGVGPARHMAMRGNDIYVSTRHAPNQPSTGIVALRLGPITRCCRPARSPASIRAPASRSTRTISMPRPAPAWCASRWMTCWCPPARAETIVDGLAATNHPFAFDGKGNLYVSIDGGGGANNCPDPNGPKDKPVGLKPCPILETRGGVWRFDDSKPGQTLADGEHFATGIRNQGAMDWRAGDALYGAWHGRDGTSKGWPELVTPAQDDAIPDEMFRITKGTDMGWPYTYWDGAAEDPPDGAGIWRRRQDAGEGCQICQAGGGVPADAAGGAGSDLL